MSSTTYSQSPEAKLYGLLRKDMIADLIRNGIPSALAGAIVRWYDPAEQDYLARVDAWQSLLCLGSCSEDELLWFPQAFVDAGVIYKTVYQTYLLAASPLWVQQIHQVVRLVYKYHGKPRKDTDWEAVKARFRRPGTVRLNTVDADGIRQALSALRPPRDWFELSGRFGPGSTADRLDQWARWMWKGVNLPRNVPVCLYDLALADYKWGRDMENATWAPYGITRVGSVPKSIKSDRFVSSEPAGHMFAQLAVMDYMYDQMHRIWPTHVSLRNQSHHNRLLTERLWRTQIEETPLAGRCPGRRRVPVKYAVDFATIDLSDASDHVSRRLVSLLLPDWKEYLFSVRSTFARFPDGTLVPLRTFAPMGSGVCFPVLTLVCLGVCLWACPGDPFSVYGDDIIVPADRYDEVVRLLQACGLVVNTRKSCSSGRYRESCGKEFYNPLLVSHRPESAWYPLEITPLLIREHPSKIDSGTLEEWVSLLTQKNWLQTRENLIGMAVSAQPTKLRYNHELQREEVRVQVLKPRLRGQWLGGREGLARWYAVRTQRDDFPIGDIITPSRDVVLAHAWRACDDFPLLTSWLISRASEEK